MEKQKAIKEVFSDYTTDSNIKDAMIEIQNIDSSPRFKEYTSEINKIQTPDEWINSNSYIDYDPQYKTISKTI